MAATVSPTPSSVTSTASSSSVFKYDTTANAAIAIGESKVINISSTKKANFGPVNAAVTSNATATLSSSNVYESSTGPAGDTASYSTMISNASNPSERINPFDKNNKSQEKRIDSVSVNATSSEAVDTISTSSASIETSLDDLTKNRFEKYQGVQNQSTGRYVTSFNASDDTKLSSAVTNIISNPSYMLDDRHASNDRLNTKVVTNVSTTNTTITTATTTSTNESKRSDAAKYSFGSASSYSRSGSMSDADIIFGDIAKKGSNHSSFERAYSTASDTTQKRPFGGYNRSLSVSSDKDGDFSHDPRVNTSYRVYEGIQNAGFTDFDSPVKTINPPAVEDDEYDLK